VYGIVVKLEISVKVEKAWSIMQSTRIIVILLSFLIALSACGRTALMRAIDRGDKAAVRSLLERGVNLEEKDDEGYTALMYAASNGHTGIVRILLKMGANVNAKTFDGETALMCAAVNGNTGTVGILLDNGADMWAKTSDGDTALTRAVVAGYSETADMLSAGWRALEKNHYDVK
jgi:ankyrin repeat protein